MQTVYPTNAEIRTAGPRELMRWNRFLPSPRTDDEARKIKLIVERLREVPDNERVRASKAVGW